MLHTSQLFGCGATVGLLQQLLFNVSLLQHLIIPPRMHFLTSAANKQIATAAPILYPITSALLVEDSTSFSESRNDKIIDVVVTR